jgi:arsenate reductase (thioredoxin)
VEATLARRLKAEAVGTAFLVAVVVGSGIAAERLSPDDVGLQLLENSLATAAALVALILAFGSVSGAHLNPVVTLAERLTRGTTTRDAGAYVAAQVAGACVGAMVANAMFDLPAVSVSDHVRSSGHLWSAEVVATFGLVTVILGVVRSGRTEAVPFAVAGYIGAAYWFTSSTSFANPAVTVGRTLSDTFAGISPSSVPAFVAAQVVGGLAATGLAVYLHPHHQRADLVVPHRHHHAPTTEAPAMPNAEETDATTDTRPVVLFLCVHNAGRSQMALGWFAHLAGGRAVARSGGSAPGDELNPTAVLAMAEVGIDISGEQPERWTDEIVRAADVVVTMGCGDECPFFPGKRYEDWDLDDPAGQPLDTVRPIRDEIGRRVRALLTSLGITPVG